MRIYINQLVAIVNLLTEGRYKLMYQVSKVADISCSLSSNQTIYEHFKTILEESKRLITDYGLVCSISFIEIIISGLDKTTMHDLQHDISNLLKMVETEVLEQYFIHIPKDHAWWFDNSLAFSFEVSIAFTSAVDDIKEAGSCYALSRYTACVFHAMRVLEHGLRVLAENVGVVMEYKNWHNIIEEIESNIKNLAKGPKTPPNTVERLKFLSEAAKEFTYFKDGWRNHVSHNRMSYDASQAYSAISHVSAFMQHLSTQLKE